MGTDIEAAGELLAAARRITVLTGAGISTESGIPDFRGSEGVWTKDSAAAAARGTTPDAGMWFTFQAHLAPPEARQAAWRARLTHPAWAAEPNAGHRALVDLERDGRLRTLLTQNVDGLHQRAGSSPDIVAELHGSMLGTVCLTCGARGVMADALDRVRAGEAEPDCPVCGGALKPTTVAFGDALDVDVLRTARTAALDCDLMLVIGTSLVVQPAASFVGLAAQAGATVVICTAEPTPYDELAAVLVRDPIGRVLSELVATPVVESDGPIRTWGDPSSW
jgi:NAD-dependent deacetylase